MKQGFQGIKQAELAESLGATPDQIKRFRDHEMKRGEDWDKDGVVIYWSHDAAERFRAKLQKPEPEQSTEIEVGEAMVVRLPKNASYVEVAIDGICNPVRVRKGAGPKLLGKKIRFTTDENGNLIHLR